MLIWKGPSGVGAGTNVMPLIGRGVVTPPLGLATCAASKVKRAMPVYAPGETGFGWHKQLPTNNSPQGAKATSKGTLSSPPVTEPLKEAFLAASNVKRPMELFEGLVANSSPQGLKAIPCVCPTFGSLITPFG